jgi:hypothetical protein
MQIQLEGMKELAKEDLTTQINYWVGRLTLAIGRGEFRDQVNLMIQYYMYQGHHNGETK